MVDSLLYLTASRSHIKFVTCLCVRFQADPRKFYLVSMKKFFKYLKGTPKLCIQHPRVFI